MSGRTSFKNPMHLHKGLLCFALACALLWGSMWLSPSSSDSPVRTDTTHTYDLSGEAWQGITRVELQGIASGMTLSVHEHPRLVSRNDNAQQPRLTMTRQGNTLVISAQAEDAHPNGQTGRKRARAVGIQNLALPAQVLTLESDTYLVLNMAEARHDSQGPAQRQSLTLIGSDIRFTGDIAHLQVQLRPRNPGALCGKTRGRSSDLKVHGQGIQSLEIAAPNRSQITLDMAPNEASTGEAPRITLQTGPNSRLELQSVALLDQIKRLPAVDEAAEDCPEASASVQAAEHAAASIESEDHSDYSD